jgi:hypothetical protein
MQMIKDNRDRPACRFFVNTVMNLRVMSKARGFLASFRSLAKDKPYSFHAQHIRQTVLLSRSGRGADDRS